MKIKIPTPAAEVISTLEDNGYEAYAVGGCVRDALLLREPNDWDVTTSAHPHDIIRIFESESGFKAIPTGIVHGTVTVIHRGMSIEVTTFRIDGEYTDSRHPDTVLFTDRLSADLARRDFTVNAMAYSDKRGLVDLYGGADDLESRIIRCVGNPTDRFLEDALRILRALRFSSVLDFEIERTTADAVMALYPTLVNVSRERISSELSRLVCGKGAARVIRDFSAVIANVLNGINIDKIDEICRHIEALYPSSAPLMLAALLCGVDAEERLRLLRFDNATVSLCRQISAHADTVISSRADVKRLCRDIGFGATEDILRFKIARGDGDEEMLDILEKIIARDECVSLAGLNIGGDELISLGASGREIGDILDLLLEKVIAGELNNEKTALLNEAVRVIKSKGN